MKTRIALSALVCFVCAGGALTAQTVEPEEPGIILPPMFLEIEDLSVESVEAVLPFDDFEILPEFSLLLPDAGELNPTDESFDMVPPEQPSGGLLFTADGQRPASLFSEGIIGLGMLNTMLGDLSLYKLGPEPRFSIHFLYESLDGYGFRPAGTGFFHEENAIDGTFEFNAGDWLIGGAAGVKVTDEGLQDNGPYGSVSHRFIGAGMDFMVSPSQRFVFEGSLGISSGSQILTSATPRIVSGFDFDPELSLKVLLGNITLAMNAGYSYSYFDGAEGLNAAAASLRFSMESPKGFDGAAWFGIDWASIPIIRYPFGLSFEGPLGQSSSFRLEGGYLTRRHPSFVLWEDYPLLDTSEPLVFDSGWYGDGDFRFIIARSLVLSAGARFERLDRSIVRSDSVDPATGLFPTAVRAESIRFTPRGQLTWRLSESFTVTGALSTEILDSSGFDPSLSAEIDAAFTHSSDRFGASAYMLFDVFGEFLWPDAGLSAFYRITDGVDLELRARDLFAIGPARGRTIWGEYETPGFRVLLMTRISL